MGLNRWTLFHDLKDSEIVTETASFVTKTFLIRYADESVKLDHAIKFSTEVEVGKFHQNPKLLADIFDPENKPSQLNHFSENRFFLRVELLFAPNPAHVSIADSAISAENLKNEVRSSYPLSKFKKVQTKLY